MVETGGGISAAASLPGPLFSEAGLFYRAV